MDRRFALILLLWACKPGGNDGLSPQGEGGLLLKGVGGARVDADKNSDITLSLVATVVGKGPAANLEVDVDFQNGEKGQLLDRGKLKTDAAGFLSIRYHTPDEENATVLIRCRAEGAPTFTFTVYVAKDIVKIDWDGRKPRLMKKGTTDDLYVIATNQRGAPVPDVEITVELKGGSDYGAGFPGQTTEWTDGSGMARFPFDAGNALTSYDLKASAPRLNDAALEIVVVEQLPSVESCTFSSDCGDNEICVEGVCTGGSRRCRDNHPEDCPTGYVCENSMCVGGCAGPSCMAPPGADLDVTGRWRTSYLFSFKESLGMLKDLGGPLGDLDTLLQGKLTSEIPVFGPILEVMLTALIKAYVPDWVPKLATALNDLWTALDDTLIAGRMDLRPQTAGSNVLLGEETWDVVEVKIASLCERRQNDPNYPRCAKVNVQLGRDLGGGTTAKATVKPFVGVIQGKEVSFTGRQAELELKKLIANLIDLIGNIASNGRAKTIEEAVPLIIDCEALKDSADELACDLTNGSTCELGWFVPVCKVLAKALGIGLGMWAEDAPLDWQLVDFSQTCTARDNSKPANVRADLLEGGMLTGQTNIIADRPMTGTFSATR